MFCVGNRSEDLYTKLHAYHTQKKLIQLKTTYFQLMIFFCDFKLLKTYKELIMYTKKPHISVRLLVIPFGFEPKTYCLEGSCSIQLSYGTFPIKKGDDRSSPVSGRQDSNLRPPGPKPGAMTGLRYAPIESVISTLKLFNNGSFSVLGVQK